MEEFFEELDGLGIVEETELPDGEEAEALAEGSTLDLSSIEDSLLTIETQQNSEFLVLTEVNESLIVTNDYLKNIQDFSYVLAITVLFSVVMSVMRRWVYSWERRV